MFTKQNIEIFFFGSPAKGFSTYPTGHEKLAKSYDGSSKKKGELDFTYSIENNNTIIRYIKYGLTGVGNKSSSRGGRNFGIYIKLNEYKINKSKLSNLSDLIKKFIQKGIIEYAHVFESDDQDHYRIKAFQDVQSKLDEAIIGFKEKIVKEFETDFEIIKNNETFFFDFNPSKIIDEKTPDLHITNYDTDEKIDNDVLEEKKTGNSFSKKFSLNFSLINTLLLLLLLVISVKNCTNSTLTYEENKTPSKIKSQNKNTNNSFQNQIEQLKGDKEKLETKVNSLNKRVSDLEKDLKLRPSPEQIKKIQTIINTEVKDGEWGDKSNIKLNEFIANQNKK